MSPLLALFLALQTQAAPAAPPAASAAPPPGDVVALAANPTVVARLTGAEPALVRAAALHAATPAELPPAPELVAIRETILARQMALLERELVNADCDSLRAHVAWLRRVAPEEGIDVRVAECRKPQVVEVELVSPTDRR